jgi:hypothetical protein
MSSTQRPHDDSFLELQFPVLFIIDLLLGAPLHNQFAHIATLVHPLWTLSFAIAILLPFGKRFLRVLRASSTWRKPQN